MIHSFVLISWLAAFAAAPPAHSQESQPRADSPQSSQPASQPSAEPSIEDEVLANLRSLPSGDHTLAEWNFPEEFLRRVADRVIRASYERNFRRVVHDRPPQSQPASASAPASQPAPERTAAIEQSVGDDAALARLATLQEARPALRSFRFPLRGGETRQPSEPPSEALDAPAAAAARMVARELATRGLLKTTARAADMLGAEYLAAVLAAGSDAQQEAVLRRLASTGIPIDWLAAFSDAGAPEFALLRRIASDLRSGRARAELDAVLDAIPFRPRQSSAGFALLSEAGGEKIGEITVQLSRGNDWLAAGDGGAVDILRQLVGLAESSSLRVLAARDDADAILHALKTWPAARDVRIMLHRSPLPVAQWAQDNQKFGRAGGRVRRIVPRYPTRGEDGATFVPGEAAWGCLDPDAVQSPLLFQGGNLLCVHDAKKNERILLLGEAELHRNVAFGLTRAQALEALRVEFGVDRCVVLPAASFHIDFELCVRTVDGAPVAFMNDADAARRVILSCGIDVLQRCGALAESEARTARQTLADGNVKEFVNIVGRGLISQALNFGVFPERLAEKFSTGPADSGTGNFLLFLHAMDSLLALSLPDAEVPQDRQGGYARAIRRDAAVRTALQEQIGKLGWKTVKVPGISNGQRGITYVNGVHTATAYWMPAWGGLYAPLDEAAAQVFRSALGPNTQVVPIRTSETQRRGGGLHCAISVAPAASP